MQSQTSDNSGFNKLKSIAFLGLSCNHTTIIGCVLVWVFLSRNEFSSFWHNIKMVFCVMPFFMGDAVNKYVLGRVKLEYDNGWDDICMATNHKAIISKLFKLYRIVSILSAYGIAVIMVYLMTTNQVPQWLLYTVASIASIHLFMALYNIIKGIAPVIPHYKKKGLIYRGVFIVLAISLWVYILLNSSTDNISNLFVFTSGILYFIICGVMHPLPAKGSLFQSIIKESIISQAQAEARAKTSAKEQILYNINSHNVEDASIVESEIDTNKTADNNSETAQFIKTEESPSTSDDKNEISDAVVVSTEIPGDTTNEQQ